MNYRLRTTAPGSITDSDTLLERGEVNAERPTQVSGMLSFLSSIALQ